MRLTLMTVLGWYAHGRADPLRAQSGGKRGGHFSQSLVGVSVDDVAAGGIECEFGVGSHCE
jgi:hypothetical protein